MNSRKINLLICCLLMIGLVSQAKQDSVSKKKHGKGATTSTEVTKPTTAYEKIFKSKKDVSTAKSFATIHKVDSKVYLEVPNDLFGRELLLNTYVQKTSDVGVLYVGMQTAPSKRIVLDRTDSLVLFRFPANEAIIAEDSSIKNALERSKMTPIGSSFPIIGVNKDSTAVLFDCTDFFSISNTFLVNLKGHPVGNGIFVYETEGIKERSRVGDVVAYSQSVGLNYETGIRLKLAMAVFGFALQNQPEISGELKITLTLLSDQKMVTREADSRIGTRYVPYVKYRSVGGAETGAFVCRRNLIPSDSAQVVHSGATYPIKPITFYVDTLFSPSWYKAIEEGLMVWNDPLEGAGFRSAIQVYPYPSTSNFNADDPLLNTVRFNAATATNVSTRTLTDPSTGEIIGGAIYIPRDFVEAVRKRAVYDISNVDARYRDYFVGDEAVAEVLRAYVMKSAAFLLGLMPNNAGSYAYTMEQLRDPKFTSTFGITSSVTDDVLFNTAAKIGDKERGVATIINKPGVYDYYAIKWLYSPIVSSDEKATLEKWIKEKEGNGEYRYGRPHKTIILKDPRTQTSDLGNDHYRSMLAGIERMKYIVNQSPAWLKDDRIPSSYISLFPDFVFLKFKDYVDNMVAYVGGAYHTDTRSDSKLTSFKVVPRSIQKQVVSNLFKVCDDVSWMDNKAFVHLGGPNNNMSDLNYMAFPITSLMFRLKMVAFTAEKSDDPYTVKEYLDDISNFVFKDIQDGKELSKQHFGFASQYVMYLIGLSPTITDNYKANGPKSSDGIALTEEADCLKSLRLQFDSSTKLLVDEMDSHGALELSEMISAGGRMDAPAGVYYYYPDSFEPIMYLKLQQAKDMFTRGMAYCTDNFTKDKYRYYITRIDRALKSQK